MFDEVMRGAFPRRIRTGWGEHTEIPTVRFAGDRDYEKVNVNQVWSTIRGHDTFASPTPACIPRAANKAAGPAGSRSSASPGPAAPGPS